MRRLILQTGVSIDGYVAALDKAHSWGVEREDEGIKRWVLESAWAAVLISLRGGDAPRMAMLERVRCSSHPLYQGVTITLIASRSFIAR